MIVMLTEILLETIIKYSLSDGNETYINSIIEFIFECIFDLWMIS